MSDLHDPRVLLAAERTLLAWNRTGISLMAFGFVVERFGLFVEVMEKGHCRLVQRNLSFSIGAAFIGVATIALFYSIIQFRRVVKTLGPSEIPEGYNTVAGIITNGGSAVLGAILTLYIVHGFM